ncbi:MAG: hypothetical protein GX558_10130 [Clostridiales bacterium]|nr:hypothetical protein [Clostridiales bacterium]
MRLSENRPLAVAALAIAVLVSVVISGGGALRDERAAVERVFYADRGVNADLTVRAEAAYNLASLAGRNGLNAPTIDAVSQAIAALQAAGSIAGKYEADQALTRAVEDLYTEMENAGLSVSDASFARKQYTNWKSSGMTIAHSVDEVGAKEPGRGYNEKAGQFNRTLQGFPAGLIGALTGVGPLELYR